MKKHFILGLGLFVLASVSWTASTASPSEDIEVTVKEVDTFGYCCLPHRGPFTEIEAVIQKFMGLMQSQNIMPMGPMLGVYYSDPNEVAAADLQWEIGFPVSEQLTPQTPLEMKTWSYTTVATAIHQGAYEETGDTYNKMFEWLAANGYEMAGPVLEKYLTMPTPETKPEDLRAEIWVPVKKKQE